MNLRTILGRAGDAITESRANRLAIAGERASRNFVDDLKKDLEKVQGEMEDLMDISATVDANAGQAKLTSQQMEDLVTKYHEKRNEEHLIKQKLKVAEDVYTELCGGK